jgi:hypothetical protein
MHGTNIKHLFSVLTKECVGQIYVKNLLDFLEYFGRIIADFFQFVSSKKLVDCGIIVYQLLL